MKLDLCTQKKHLILKPDIILKSGINKIDQIVKGFKAGEITVIEGDNNSINNISTNLCVNTFKTFKTSTIYLDGGTCIDPYKIAKYARKIEMDQKNVLKNLHISRAFTIYQMTTLIQEKLEQVIKRYNPRTLIISKIPVLYHDEDVKTKEAQVLLKENIKKIRYLTKKYDLITIFTCPDFKRFGKKSSIKKIINKNASEIVKIKQKSKEIKINLIKKGIENTFLTVSIFQKRLQDFGMVID